MPNPIKKRTWCTTCQEFETFESHLTSGTTVLDAAGKEIKKLSKTTCDTCGNEYVPYHLSESHYIMIYITLVSLKLTI